jgi:hypothetical protein
MHAMSLVFVGLLKIGCQKLICIRNKYISKTMQNRKYAFGNTLLILFLGYSLSITHIKSLVHYLDTKQASICTYSVQFNSMNMTHPSFPFCINETQIIFTSSGGKLKCCGSPDMNWTVTLQLLSPVIVHVVSQQTDHLAKISAAAHSCSNIYE